MNLVSKRSVFAVIATMFSLFAVPVARAQDAPAADTVKHVKFTANLGLAMSSGNTKLTTLTAGDELVWTPGVWSFKQVLAFIYGKSDSVETANQVLFGLRADRRLAKSWALYLGARYERNTFAGYDSRYSENLGVTWNAIAAPKDKLDLEAGAGLTQQKSTTGATDDHPDGRLAAVYRHTWKEKTYFQEAAEALPDLRNSNNLRVNSLAELIAPLSTSIGMRVTYLVQYDELPEPGFKTTDQVLTAGLQVSF